jgi:hypothetical protein
MGRHYPDENTSQSGFDLAAVIRAALERSDPSELLRGIGYPEHSLPNASKRLAAVLADPDLGLRSSRYDFRYSNREFLIALVDALAIDREPAIAAIDALQRKLQRQRYAFRPWIFVETCFRRSTEPVFALAAMEGRRRIRMPESAILADRKELVRIASEKAKEHFQRHQGQLPLWGEIREYKLILENEEQVVLDPAGAVVRVEPVRLSSQATLRLR